MEAVYLKKWRNPLHTLGGKLFLIYFISITFMVAGFGYFSYDQSRKAIEKKFSQTASQVIALAADKVETEIKAYQDITIQMIADADLLGLIRDFQNPNLIGYEHYAIQNKLEKKLSLVALWRDGLRNVSILPLKAEKGLRGKTYSGVPLNDSPIGEKWFQQVVEENGRAVYLPTREKGYYASDKPAFGIARLVIDGSTGHKLAVLLLEIDEDVLEKAVGDLSFGKEASVVVLDQENRFIRAQDIKEIGKNAPISFTAKERDTALKGTVISNRNGNIVIYQTLDVSNWVVATAIPTAELMRESEGIRNMTILLILGAVLVAILLGIWVLKMVGDPLNQLQRFMSEAENGNLTVRMKAKRNDEIGDVGRSFNHMMERFSALIREIYQNTVNLRKHAEMLLQSSKNTASSAKDLASAMEEIAKGVGELAAEAERGTKLTEEVKSKMLEAEGANSQMIIAVGEVDEASRQGSAFMEELTGRTASQEELTKKMVNRITDLKKSVESIRGILDILHGITKQTNILSLNASIEAARAGEAGKGFAVVADEIRNLADQSKNSIEVVGETIDKIDQELFQTMEAVGEVTALFREQIASIREADALFMKVNEKMGLLNNNLEQVTGSLKRLEERQRTLVEIMEMINRFSEESSASSEEVASIGSNQLEESEALVRMSESLEELSRDLEAAIQRFKVK